VQPFGKLTVIVDGAPETEYTLAKGIVALGRGTDNDIVLADRLVSTHHAQVVCTPEGCESVDLGNSNGILVNGRHVGAHRLRDGDVPTQSAVLRGAEIHPVRQHHGSLYIDQDVRARLIHELSGPF
jgi:pSer/pThr/pTyr-binding forkhead associated (FHA) protein